MTNDELNARREAIARIIDPQAFRLWGSMYDYCLKQDDTEDEAEKYADGAHGPEKASAFTKADAILAALESRPAPTEERARQEAVKLLIGEKVAGGDGCTYVLRAPSIDELTQALLRFATETQPDRIREAGARMARRMGGKFILHEAETQPVATGEQDHVVDVTDMITTPERAKALEDALHEVLAEGNILDPGEHPALQRALQKLDAAYGALSASPPEVVEQQS